MTTMPLEMSTTKMANPMTLPNIKDDVQSDTHLMQCSSRSRFMITDILAGSEAAESVVFRNKYNTDSVKNLINNSVTYHTNHATIEQYLSQQNEDLIRQQTNFAGSTFRCQQSTHSTHTHNIFGSRYGQGRQHTPLPTRDLLFHTHAPTTIGATLIDLGSEAHIGKVGVVGDDYEVCQDDHSQSPQSPTQSNTNYSVEYDRGKVTEGGGPSRDPSITFDDSDSDTCGGKDEDDNSGRSDSLIGLTKKQRKARTAFTDHQLQTLEKSFERQKYLSVQDRMELANKLELSDCQVKTWYQNRRTKWKRQTAVGLELLAEAGNYAAFQRLYGSHPFLPAWSYTTHDTPVNGIDLYYRQAAAAAVLQKPVSYRMYPSILPMNSLSSLPLPPSSLTHHNPSNTISTLSAYYHSAGIVQHPQSNNSFSQVHGPNQHLSGDHKVDCRSVGIPSNPQLNPSNTTELNEKEEKYISKHIHDIDEDAIEV